MNLPCACTTTRKANRALFRYYEEAMATSGVTVTQFAILRSLGRLSPRPLSALAEELVMERTSLYRTLSPLISEGWVRITKAPRGRAKLATLTAKGKAQMEHATPFWESAQKNVVARIGEDRWEVVSQFLLDIPATVDSLR